MMHVTVQQISASLDGALTGPSLELVVRHLAVCHECRDRQARLAKHDDALRRLLAQEPRDEFMDDLSRRAEQQVAAIARGVPAPAIVTSVPLLHEEDPYAPTEPSPPPARPDAALAGDVAKQAGWGRIGLKPTASTQAPQSDPAEAQRMLDALAGGATGAFMESTTPQPADGIRADAPIFELPGWASDRAKPAGPAARGPRDVPRLSLFLGNRDEQPGATSREPGHEASRRDEAFEPPSFEEGSLARDLDAYEVHETEPVPPEHAPYAPPGWTSEPAAPTGRILTPASWSRTPDPAPAPAEPKMPPPPEWDRDPEPAEPDGPGASAWDLSTPPAESRPYSSPTWDHLPGPHSVPVSAPGDWAAGSPLSAPAGEFAPPAYGPGTSPLAPSPYLRPMTQPVHDYVRADIMIPEYKPPGRGLERMVVLALVTVGGLLLILLALQLIPATPPRSSGAGRPHIQASPVPGTNSPGQNAAPGAPSQPQGHDSVTRPPLDQVLPPLVQPESDAPAEPSAPPPSASPDAATPRASAATTTPARTQAAAGAAALEPPARAHAGHTTAPATHAPRARAATAGQALPSLCGRIEDDAGQPVAGARVSMAEISLAIRTDGNGHFCMSAPPGVHHLFVEASGFTPQGAAVTLSASSPELRLRLQPAR